MVDLNNLSVFRAFKSLFINSLEKVIFSRLRIAESVSPLTLITDLSSWGEILNREIQVRTKVVFWFFLIYFFKRPP